MTEQSAKPPTPRRRILIINQYFPPDVAASAYLLGELAEDIRESFDVSVLAGRPSYDPDAGVYRPQGVRVVRSWSTSFKRSSIVGRILNYLTFLLTALLKGMRQPRPDVVMAFTDPPIVAVIGLLCARRYRVPFVYVCMDIFPDIGVALGTIRSRVVIGVWKRINRLVRGGADRVVAIGRDMVEKLEAEGVPRDKLAFLPNWANDFEIDPGAYEHVRQENAWEGKFIVMHAGNIGLAQNLAVVIEAAERLRKEKDVLFVLIGDGAAKRRLMRMSEERDLSNISFVPYLPKMEAQKHMMAADVHVISLVPGLRGCAVPSKMYAIMAASKPFVAAVDEGAEPQRVANEFQCGIRVLPNNSQELAEAIRKMRDEGPKILNEMGERGRKGFEERYERTRVTSKFDVLLEQVIDEGNSKSTARLGGPRQIRQ